MRWDFVLPREPRPLDRPCPAGLAWLLPVLVIPLVSLIRHPAVPRIALLTVEGGAEARWLATLWNCCRALIVDSSSQRYRACV